MDIPGSSSQANLEADRPARLHGSACDSCRRRRVRCDGQQPCERCQRSQVACTYGSTAHRASAVSYARHLEQKIAELRTLLHQKPSLESKDSAAASERSEEDVRREALDMLVGPGDDFVYRVPESQTDIFYGRFGGLSVMRTIGTDNARRAHSPSLRWFSRELVQAFDVLSLSPNPTVSMQAFTILPPKTDAQRLSELALDTALVCHECLDRPAFGKHFARLYDIDFEDYTSGDRSFLALLYVMIALGKRFSPMSEEDEVDGHSERLKFKGLAYFHASCRAFNATDSNDLNAVRTIICQARYLSSMSMISKAYSKICIGAAIALRLGLHTSSPAVDAAFSPQELFERRKVFATLNMMEVYLSSLLGLPLILKDADPKQLLGLPNDDVEDEGRSYVLQNTNSALAQTVLCQKINQIMARICQTRISLGKSPPSSVNDHYEENIHEVADREAEIEEWATSLPALPTEPSDVVNLQGHLTLRLWQAIVQIVLYRPFLHHLVKSRNDIDFNIRGFEYGSKCVQAATQGILTVEVFHNYGLLHEGYWVCVYMLQFAVSILAYFISSSPELVTVEASTSAAAKARDLLGELARYNLSARKCYLSLKVVLDAL